MINRWSVATILIVLVLAGCAQPIVRDAAGNESISGASMTCSRPYRFVQDCSMWSGATRTIELYGRRVKIAGSASGREVLVMDPKILVNTLMEVPIVGQDTTRASNNSFVAVKKQLLANQIGILKVIPVMTLGRVDGYVLELDGDGYSLLKRHTPGGATVGGAGSTEQSAAPAGPLSQLAGDWNMTVFLIGAGRFGGRQCGTRDRSGHSRVTIAPPTDGGVSLSVGCDDGSYYAFQLKHGAGADGFLLTVRSKAGISVVEFPVAYVEGEGWMGAREQLVNGKQTSVTGTVATIEGREWYGWTIAALPTADIQRGPSDVGTPYLKVDLTRPK